MKNSIGNILRNAALVTALIFNTVTVSRAQSTAFTYQGRLEIGGSPVTQACNLEFRLFDNQALGMGTLKGSPIIANGVEVIDGVFTRELDFGAQFDGGARFLEIRVACGSNPQITLPRQPITATPYALFARDVANNAVTSAKIADGTVTAADLSSGLSLPPTGAAGGSLSGSYPNPAIAANAISNAHLQDNAVTSTEIANGTITAADLASGISFPPSGTAAGSLSGTYPNPGIAANAVGSSQIQAAFRLPQSCTNNQIPEWNGSAWVCSVDDAGGLTLPFLPAPISNMNPVMRLTNNGSGLAIEAYGGAGGALFARSNSSGSNTIFAENDGSNGTGLHAEGTDRGVYGYGYIGVYGAASNTGLYGVGGSYGVYASTTDPGGTTVRAAAVGGIGINVDNNSTGQPSLRIENKAPSPAVAVKVVKGDVVVDSLASAGCNQPVYVDGNGKLYRYTGGGCVLGEEATSMRKLEDELAAVRRENADLRAGLRRVLAEIVVLKSALTSDPQLQWRVAVKSVAAD